MTMYGKWDHAHERLRDRAAVGPCGVFDYRTTEICILPMCSASRTRRLLKKPLDGGEDSRVVW